MKLLNDITLYLWPTFYSGHGGYHCMQSCFGKQWSMMHDDHWKSRQTCWCSYNMYKMSNIEKLDIGCNQNHLFHLFLIYSAMDCWMQYLCALQWIHVYTINCGQASSWCSQCFINAALVNSSLSSHSGGVWLEAEHVVHTRQEGGPLPTQWPPSPATTTSNSLQLSSRTGVWTRVL